MFPSDEQPTMAQQMESYQPIELPPNLRIAFIHPDLGLGSSPHLPSFSSLPVAEPQRADSESISYLGGAERLVVDAALALKKRGHEVEIFTSYHEDGKGGRSFEETRNGKLHL